MSETNLDEYGPEIYTPAAPATKGRGKAVVYKVRATIEMIKALEGGMNNFIHVLVPGNPKLSGYAKENWPLYGTFGKPSVTVGQFVEGYPLKAGGKRRARESLSWDLERGYIGIDGLELERV